MTAKLPSKTTAVIGAGPYGLSIAAHLRARGVPTHVFGEPLESWQAMPARMNLKSVWSASSLSDPEGAFSLDKFCRATGSSPAEPIPLAFFLKYADWFREHGVAEIDRVLVQCVRRQGSEFELMLSDGRAVDAARVVVAVGVRQFAFIPEFARGLPVQLASHSGEHIDFSRFRDCRVAVIGAGQSALESAAILHDEGARVEVIARGPVHWINRTLYHRGGLMRTLLYPPTDVGPPGLNWLCGAPMLMRRLPVGLRKRIETRAVRPAGAGWLRPRVEGKIPVTAFTEVLETTLGTGGLRLRLSDGTSREVDHLLLGTGYRPDVGQIPFLDSSVREKLDQHDGFPVLDEWFESSVAGLHFVGGLAGRTFGPICRFVAGAHISAQRVARRAAELN
ncbi:MAG: NAD(P)/FAD-dependent oxidoreductase [Chloroflexi bacterium]|nr:MAG: NAD(P)/FAD-dependent oxidoreductase [Chloroflexota bacterium]